MEKPTEGLITLPKYGSILASEISDYAISDQLEICSHVLGLANSEMASLLNKTELELTGFLTQTRRGRTPLTLRHLSQVTSFLLGLTGSIEYTKKYFDHPLEPEANNPITFRGLFSQGKTKRAIQYIQELSA